MSRWLLLLVLAPSVVWAAPPQCRTIEAALKACQVELAGCKTDPVKVTTGPEIRLATAPYRTTVTATVSGETSWSIAETGSDGTRYVSGDWLMEYLAPGAWTVTFIPPQKPALGIGMMTITVTSPKEIYQQVVVVEVK